MRYSKIFGKTRKSSKEYDSVNATFLIRGGFIDQTMAGAYTFLPLGLRVLNKIENIIRDEMNVIGEELLMPALSPKELWKETGRLETVSVLFKVLGANALSAKSNGSEYILNSTHEEIITPIAKKFHSSYRDLPFAVYQIQTKFRNEPRPKSGLLRCREFRMKDLYSFHASSEDMEEYYEKAKIAYKKVFERVGLEHDTVIVLASGGDFTEKFSHEFQTKCSAGEDIIFFAKKANVYYNREIAPSLAPKINAHNEKPKKMENILGEGIRGVEELAKFFGIPKEKTTKTLLFTSDTGEIIAATVRGNYDISVEKLKKAAGCKDLELSDSATVKTATGAEVGYAGIINLSPDIRVFIDNSLDGAINFECGANKTNYHAVNVNFGRDIANPKKFYDIKVAQEGDLHPGTGERYEAFTACEVGNIFPLNTKFTQSIRYTYTDENGKQKPVFMGSYGIGSTRILGVLVEKYHDEHGILWPRSVAPFAAHLLALGKDKKTYALAEQYYAELCRRGIDVLFDDRPEVSSGEKFADSDLIGIPYRVVVSEKTGNNLELKKRNEKSLKKMDISKIIHEVGRN